MLFYVMVAGEPSEIIPIAKLPIMGQTFSGVGWTYGSR